jgi:hypothetical protein
MFLRLQAVHAENFRCTNRPQDRLTTAARQNYLQSHKRSQFSGALHALSCLTQPHAPKEIIDTIIHASDSGHFIRLLRMLS